MFGCTTWTACWRCSTAPAQHRGSTAPWQLTRPPNPAHRKPAGMDKEAVLAEVGSMRWGDFKPRLADALVAHLQPIQARYAEVMQDEGSLDAILAKVGRGRLAAVGRVCWDCSAVRLPGARQCCPAPVLLYDAGRGQCEPRGVRHARQRAQGHGLWHRARPPLGRVNVACAELALLFPFFSMTVRPLNAFCIAI